MSGGYRRMNSVELIERLPVITTRKVSIIPRITITDAEVGVFNYELEFCKG